MGINRRSLLQLSGLGVVGTAGSAAVVSTTRTPAPDGGNELQRRYDALAAGDGGILDLPAGTMAVSLDIHSRKVNIRGAGRTATVLRPLKPGRPVLAIRHADAAWDAVTISDLSLQGDGSDGIGLGYRDDDDALFAGRTIVRNVRFAGFEKCISRPRGNIGLVLEDCQFEDAEYHLWGQSTRTASGGVMHNGALIARRCHFQRAVNAVMRSRSDVAGSGQVVFEDCIFENNPGFVFIFERFESRDSVPGIVLRSCWNEANATGTQRLRLGGRDWAPAFIVADSVASIECQDTPPGSVVLLGDTSLITRGCALDLFDVTHADAAATVVHHDARIFGGKVVDGLTTSVVNANQKNEGPSGAIFRLPHRIATMRPAMSGSHDTSLCRSPILVDGSRRSMTQPVRDAVMPGEEISQELTLMPGDKIFLNKVAVPAGAFVAWTFSYRLVAGDPAIFQVTGSEAISTTVPTSSRDWATIGGVTFVRRTIAELGFWFTAQRTATLRLGGYQLLCLPTRSAATEHLNDRLFRSA